MPSGVCSPIPEGLLGGINKSALDPEGNEMSPKSSDRDQGHEKNGCLESSLWPQWEPGLEWESRSSCGPGVSFLSDPVGTGERYGWERCQGAELAGWRLMRSLPESGQEE